MDGHELLEQYLAGIRSFQSADLRGIKFEDADLSFANLHRANLEDANLTDADLKREI